FSFSAVAGGGVGDHDVFATITDAQARSGNANVKVTVTAAPTNPSGVMAANPNPIVSGQSTLLTVAVTPGANPTSTGLAVTGNLTLLGGASNQPFYDDGTHGDVTAGDLTFSFSAVAGGGLGDRDVNATITDAQSRSGFASMKVTVTSPPPTNPTSTGLAVTGNLSQMGGASSQTFYDDGTHGDVTAGDLTFSFSAVAGGG